jgi:hypothetical protein
MKRVLKHRDPAALAAAGDHAATVTVSDDTNRFSSVSIAKKLKGQTTDIK